MSIDIALARIKECIVERRVELDLSDLGLTEIPPEIQKIPWLEKLDCSNNKLQSLEPIAKLPNLHAFWGSDNPIKHMPHAFLDDIDNLRQYHQEIEAHGYLKNNRQKLLLLGNGRVGKTTLAWGLKESKPQKNVNQKSTIGISLLNWPMTDIEGNEWRVRIWDFGGQELYHATHRLFQSQSGVYCVVWAEKTREEESEFNHPLSYWLDLIHDSNTDVPVIVVKSQCDISDAQGFKNPALNDDRYCHYPRIRVSAWEGTGMKVLEANLSDLFSVQAELQTRIPKSWGKVRAKLETWGKTIDKSEFEELCRTLNVLHSDTLLTFLHTSGDVFFRDNYFSNTIFIDQNWALKAIYRLFETGEDIGNPRHWIERNKGRVSGKELVKIFSDYEPDEAELFTGFMLQANMMFYEEKANQDFEVDQFVVPALLPLERPKGVPNANTATVRYRLYYPWLHRLAIERIIVACHHRSSASSWWRDGISIEVTTEVSCSIFADAEKQALTLAFWGPETEIVKALSQVIKTIEWTKVTSPVKEELNYNNNGWVGIDGIRAFAAIKEKTDRLAYYYFLGLETEAISGATPVIVNFIHEENKYMTRTIINSPGANAGDISGSTVTVNIGTPEERKQKLESVEALIQALEKENFEDQRKYLGQLDTVKEELQKPEPDEDYINKTLGSFSGVMDKLEKGKELATRVATFLAGLGVTF